MKPPLRVLIVEDVEDDALLAVQSLSHRYTVDWLRVETAADYIAAIKAASWDVILADHVLPSFSAAEALAIAHRESPYTPVIVVSGVIEPERAVELMRDGARDFVYKARLERLSAAVERDIADASVRRERARAEEALRSTVEALRASDEQRRALLAHLVEVQERERAQLAAEIHDDSVQAMTAAAIRLEIVRDELTDARHRAELDAAIDAVRTSVVRLRHLLFELRPPVLDRVGLTAALREHIQRIQGDTKAELRLESNLNEEPPLPARIILYRLAQEALTNVRKHAFASQATVTLAPVADGTLLRVVDNGVGFDPKELDTEGPEHFGIRGMVERAHQAGGWCSVRGRPSEGTIVEAWLPDSWQDAAA